MAVGFHRAPGTFADALAIRLDDEPDVDFLAGRI
jgi:hypothetical protein